MERTRQSRTRPGLSRQALSGKSLFVDTSVWYAAADFGDRSNVRAKKVLQGDWRLVTSDHVLVESWLLLRHRLGERAAERFREGLPSGIATVEAVVAADLEVAWEVQDRFSDRGFSIVDCMRFAVMQRLGVRRVATFDDDFAVFRFEKRRERAFEIVR